PGGPRPRWPAPSGQSSAGAGGPGTRGCRIAKPTADCASSSVTRRPRPRAAPPSGLADGDPTGPDPEGDGDCTDRLGDADGPNRIRIPGRPRPSAPAIPATTSSAIRARTRDRKSVV